MVKNYLFDQENRLACTTWACARLCARKPRPRPLLLRKMTKNRILSVIFISAQRAQPRARPCSARQSILLIKEILFDYLIASVAQKLTDLAQIEVRTKIFKNEGGCDQWLYLEHSTINIFLRRTIVRENFFRVFGDVILHESLFKPIRVINRTNSRSIWTRLCEDMD